MTVTGHAEILRTLHFVERHGYVLLFTWVLAEQGAIPLPSFPLLIAAGALIRTGGLHVIPVMACCLIAAMVADTTWFQLGRHHGRRVLRLICRLSLEPDSCVRRTENAFLKYGLKSLLVSKFIPGLNSVAAPLAGQSGTRYIRFALYDAAGALIWSGAYVAAGYVFSKQLELVVAFAAQLGSNLLLLAVMLFVGWVGWKFRQRRRFLKQISVARITPAELQQRLSAGEDVFIVDLRSGFAPELALIPGAVHIPPEELITRNHEIPRDREIILFCS